MKKLLAFFNNKRFKHGGLSFALTAVVIAVVVVLNIVAGLVSERFAKPLDLSANRMFSIAEDTQGELSGLDSKLTITVASRESDFVHNGTFYNQTNEILKRFAAASPNITLNYVNLMSNPDFAAGYEGLRDDSIIVESEKTNRHKILTTENYLHAAYYDLRSGNQITQEEYNMYNSMGAVGMVEADVSAAAEGALLSAILAVTDENPVNVGFTTGYSENKNEHLEAMLEMYAYTNQSIDLVTGDIPDDLDFIIMLAPQDDYSKQSLKKLEQWLDNEGEFGKSLLYISHAYANVPNIDSFLAARGIAVEREYARQTEPRDMNNFQRFTPMEYTQGLNPEHEVYGMFMRHTSQVFEAYRNMETRVFLVAQDSALCPFEELFDDESADNDSDNSDNDSDSSDSDWDFNKVKKGEYPVGIISSKVPSIRAAEDEVAPSNVIVFGGSDMLNARLLAMQNANNAELFINIMNDISGKDAFLPTLTPKSFSIPMFEITQSTAGLLGIVFVLIIPLVIITIGIIVWIRRIRK